MSGARDAPARRLDGVLLIAFVTDTAIAVIDAFTEVVLINLVVVGHGALHAQPHLVDLRITRVVVEREKAAHAQDWHRFCTTVFDCVPPGTDQIPWCFEVPAPKTMKARLYLASAITDLRTETLEK